MYRVYDLQDGVFIMDTQVEDEFGAESIRCSADLRSQDLDSKLQIALECSGNVPVSLRIREMQQFLSLLALFDPQFNTRKDGIPQIVSQTPPWPENQP